MARYSRTPIVFYLDMGIAELLAWEKVINKEIEAENKAVKEAGQNARRTKKR